MGVPLNKADAADAADRAEIQNKQLRIVVEKHDGVYSETYFSRSGSRWVQILQSGNPTRPDPALKRNHELAPFGFQELALLPSRNGEQVIQLRVKHGPEAIQKVIRMRGDDPFVEVRVSYECMDTVQLEYLLETYSFVPDGKEYAQYKPLDFVFTPMLRPEAGDVIADHTFRSPALMMQKGSRFAALVPDLATIDGKGRPMRTSADVQVETSSMPMLSFGFMDWQKRSHVYYHHSDSLTATISNRTISFGYFLFVNASAQPRTGFEDVVRFQWERYGRPNILKSTGPQSEPFSSYINKAWYQFVPKVALDTLYKGKAVTLLRQSRLAWSNKLPKEADNDNWLNVWFNSLRTAYGMYLYGKAAGDRQLVQRAVGNLNLALSAPQENGIAPTIFYYDSSGGHWVADQAWGGIDGGEYYAMFPNTWTNYWLLQWSDLVPERKKEITSYSRGFAEFLLRHQQSSGVIPSWYHPQTMEPAKEFRDENAETAGAALFLAEFYRRNGGAKYLTAAERAMKYIFTSILPERKWFDHETFFSCSRKPLGFFDRYTQQHPQNSLSMHQAAEACYSLYKITGKKEYERHGVEIMDYLCLYQQIWSPKWLSCELFGGFGVQNTDAEWSDSRQGYFAVTMVKYYELTGNREYLERGVAAVRAMFSLFESPESPRTAENYAHSSEDRLAGVTGLHWGTGSSVVSIHLIRQQYGDAYVNVKDQWGVGIDGCRITSVKVKGPAIAVELLDNVASPRATQIMFGKLSRKQYVLTVNGKSIGKFSSNQLRKGVDVAL
jgi:hypothetical protein